MGERKRLLGWTPCPPLDLVNLNAHQRKHNAQVQTMCLSRQTRDCILAVMLQQCVWGAECDRWAEDVGKDIGAYAWCRI